MASCISVPACLEKKPRPALRFVDINFQKARCRHIVVVVANLVSLAHGVCDCLVIRHKFAQHIERGNELLIIVLKCLQ